MDFMLTSTFVIILIMIISIPTLSIMIFLWLCLKGIREKIQSTIKEYSETIIKMMVDFQDIQKDFLIISKRIDELERKK